MDSTPQSPAPSAAPGVADQHASKQVAVSPPRIDVAHALLRTIRALPRGARRWFAELVDLIFGYDIFISYSWRDGGTYPRRLHEALVSKKYKVFLDRVGYTAGTDLTAATRRRVRMSTVLLLVTRPEALLRSSWVESEVREALAAGRTPILIDVNGTFETAPEGTALKPLLLHKIRIREAVQEVEIEGSRLMDGEPSESTLSEIDRHFTFTRRETFLLRVVAGAALLFAALAIWAIISAVREREARLETASALAEHLHVMSHYESEERKNPLMALLQSSEAVRRSPDNSRSNAYAVRAVHLAGRAPLDVHQLPVASVAWATFSRNLDKVMVLRDTLADNNLSVWKIDPQRALPLPMGTAPVWHVTSADAVAPIFSADERLAAAIVYLPVEPQQPYPRVPEIRIWNADTAKLQATIPIWTGHRLAEEPELPTSFAFSADADVLVVGVRSRATVTDGQHRYAIFDAQNGRLLHAERVRTDLMTVTERGVPQMSAEPSSPWIASVSHDSDRGAEIALLDPRSGEPAASGAPLFVAGRLVDHRFDPSGRVLVTTSSGLDGGAARIEVWETDTATLLHSNELSGGEQAPKIADVATDGEVVVLESEGWLWMLRPETGARHGLKHRDEGFPNRTRDFTSARIPHLSRDGGELLLIGKRPSPNSIFLTTIDSDSQRTLLPQREYPIADGLVSFALAAERPTLATVSRYGSIQLWPTGVEDAVAVDRIPLEAGLEVFKAAFTLDAEKVIAAVFDERSFPRDQTMTLRIWDARGRAVKTAAPVRDRIERIAVTAPDRFVTASRAGLGLWDMRLSLLHSLPGSDWKDAAPAPGGVLALSEKGGNWELVRVSTEGDRLSTRAQRTYKPGTSKFLGFTRSGRFYLTLPFELTEYSDYLEFSLHDLDDPGRAVGPFHFHQHGSAELAVRLLARAVTIDTMADNSARATLDSGESFVIQERASGATLVRQDGQPIITPPNVGSQYVLYSADCLIDPGLAPTKDVGRVWEASTGLPVSNPLWHESNVEAAALSRDRTHLRTLTESGVLREWYVATTMHEPQTWAALLGEALSGTSYVSSGPPTRLSEAVITQRRARLFENLRARDVAGDVAARRLLRALGP